jgi:hypothetical protein
MQRCKWNKEMIDGMVIDGVIAWWSDGEMIDGVVVEWLMEW